MKGGNAAPKIIQYSEKENFDTIIMGHSGMSGFKKDVTWECIKSSNKSKQKNVQS